MEYIDNYFSSIPAPEIKKEFEDKIHNDPLFAEDVAFYLSAHKTIKEDAEAIKERFREIYKQYRQAHPIATQPPSLIRKLWPYVAAAAVIIGLIFGVSTFFTSGSPQRMADTFIKVHFQKLGVSMSTRDDSIQKGLQLYNNDKPGQALAQFESIIQHDKSSVDALRYAGISALRLGDYDKALKYFEELENYPGLEVNPGKIYHAITLMKRGQKGDNEKAKLLLNEVVQNNLDGKPQATEWLRKF